MNKTLLLISLSLICFYSSWAQTTILTEDFETDGEGVRYAGTFIDGTDVLHQTNLNPAPSYNTSISNISNTGYIYSEDVDGAAAGTGAIETNPNHPLGILTLNSVSASGVSNFEVKMLIGEAKADGRFEGAEYVEIQANVDGGGYSAIGRFKANATLTGSLGGFHMSEDSPLGGVLESTNILNATLTEYSFLVPTVGTSIQVRVVIATDGGSEEIVFDNIRIIATSSSNDAPVLANIEGASIEYSEGDPASQISNTITVSDGDDANWASASVTISSGFNGSEDVLAFTPSGGITGSYASGTGVLSLSGSSSLANYQTVLRSVTYQNTDATDASSATRTIQFQVNDGTDASNFQNRNINITTALNAAIALPACESFETNGEGTRYASNTFDMRPGSDDFFTRSTLPVAEHTTSITGIDGSYVWVGEDVNANGAAGMLTLAPFVATSFNDFNVSVLLAVSASGSSGWETSDNVLVEYSMDGGSWTTVGAFYGFDVPGGAVYGELVQDADLNGTADPAGAVLGSTLTQFDFPFNASGTSLSVRIVVDQTGGSEEIIFDNICVSGVAGQQAPVLSSIESSTLEFVEGDAALQITNAIAVADADDTHLDSAKVEFCSGFMSGEDTLTFVSSGGITGSFDSGVLTLTGNATLAQYQTVLRTVAYENNAGTNPSGLTREICFSANDGDVFSNSQSRFLTVEDQLDTLGCLPISESFETDGEGTRYASNAFDDGNSDFFILTSSKPIDHADSPGSVDGSFYWASEDVIGGANGSSPAYVEISPVQIGGQSGIQVTAALGVSNNNGARWESTDAILIQANIDNSGWTNIGAFYGDSPTGGNLVQDADLNGVADPAGAALNGTLTDYVFDVSGTGTVMQVKVVVDQDGGSEEFFFDNIRITGSSSNSLSCNDTTLYLDVTGSASLDESYLTTLTDAACGVDSVKLDIYDFTCAELGAQTVTVTAYYDDTSTQTCTSTVTVADTISPTTSCQNITVFLDGAGTASIIAADIDNGSTDNCSSVTLAASTTAFTCADLGPNALTLTVTDGSGNTSTCSSTVTVADTISPTASCQNITVFLDGAGTASIIAADIDNGSTDNCSSVTLAASTTAFTCADLGPNAVTLTVTDGSGNTSTCSSTVTVADTVSPTASCQNITVFLDGAGAASMVAADIDNGSADNCSSVTLAASTTAFACADLGPNAVTLTVTDGSGNTSTCSSIVTIVDTISPTASCQNINVFLDGAGTASIIAADIDNGSTDNCGAPTLSASATAFTCAGLGPNAVTLTVTDGSGNTSTCSSTVTVADTISPTASCQNITVFLDGAGTASIIAADIDNGSTDNCSSVTLAASTTAFTCADLGPNVVTLTVTDGSGNTSTCSSTVTVVDTISPVASCQNLTVYLDGTGNVSIDSSMVDNGSTDNCDIATITLDQSDFTCSDVGANTIMMTVIDVNSNVSTCTSTVTVMDTISPTAVCQNITVYLDGSGNVSIDSSMVDNGSTDNCAIATISLDQSDFTCGEVGVNTVMMTVTDVNTNMSTCTSTVTVIDTVSPTAVCQNLTVYLDGTGNVSINSSMVDNGSTDNCDIAKITLDQSDFTCGEVGANTIMMTVSDVNTNISTCTSTVTVMDTISPTAVCQNITVYLDGTGNVSIDSSMVDNGSTDNCDIATITLDQSDFTCSEVGANTVMMTVSDVSSNVSTCTSTVTVMDSISPTAVCQNLTVYVDGTGNVSIDSSMVDNGSTDNCAIATISLDQSDFTCSDVGANTIMMTVIDVNTNMSTCTSTVTVMDTISPTAVCQNITVYLDGTGNVSIDSSMVDNGSTDNCDIATITLGQSDFTCSDVGANTIMMTVSDVNTNMSTCTATVTVMDTISPTAVCQNITVYLDASGNASIDSSMVDNGSSDNCSIESMTLSQTDFTSADIGDTEISFVVVDASGNSDSCTATVTVVDNIAPEAKCNVINISLSEDGTYDLTADDIQTMTRRTTDNITAYEDLVFDVNPTSFDCTNLEELTSILVRVTDEAGNESTCGISVNVKDPYPLEVDSIANIELELSADACDTIISYPELVASRECVEFEQIAGLGADGVFPIGTTTETWKCTYVDGTADTVSFDVVVTKSIDGPTLDSIADVSSDEDVQIVLPLTGISGGDVCTSFELDVVASNKNASLISNLSVNYVFGESTAELEITPMPNMSGVDTITVEVGDSEGMTATRSFVLRITPVNDAPFVVFELLDQEVEVNTTYDVSLSKLLGVLFDDVDDSTLLYNVRFESGLLPAWITASDDADVFILDFAPLQTDTGCYNIIVDAIDAAGAMASDTFELCVPDLVVGIDDLQTNILEVKMYPNPTRGMVTIEPSAVVSDEVEIAVMNIAGSEVFRKTYRSGDALRFDMSDHVSGMYMVFIEINNQRVVKKLILDRD